MSLFSHRSYQKELLDRDDIPFADIKKNMEELDIINKRLGGHAITLSGFKQLVSKAGNHGTLHIMEIGCGGGDNLRVIRQWAQGHALHVRLTGVDINPECISYAQGLEANKGISFICSDFKKIPSVEKTDIIFSSLFCHHFTNEELIYQLQWMQQHARTGFFINDLQRHPVAYHSISILTKIFSKSYLVKNDAPLSVLRGFVRSDWNNIFSCAGITNFTCKWKWAFRWLIIYEHGREAGI